MLSAHKFSHRLHGGLDRGCCFYSDCESHRKAVQASDEEIIEFEYPDAIAPELYLAPGFRAFYGVMTVSMKADTRAFSFSPRLVTVDVGWPSRRAISLFVNSSVFSSA